MVDHPTVRGLKPGTPQYAGHPPIQALKRLIDDKKEVRP
jgi:hypothetical protein